VHAFSIGGVKSLVTAMLMWVAILPANGAPPHLENHGETRQLVVNGRPFLILGGELGNSSASSAEYMKPRWPQLAAMHLNTVLAPISWELVEPQEGRFDWSSVTELLRDARAHDLKLVVLWFGAWKNSMSTYVPSWVKRDTSRFPRAKLATGQSVEILSAFGPATRAADVRAFSALLEHLAEVDSTENTVLMVQVENEIGMLPIARERGAVADQLFGGAVPLELTRALKKPAGTWTQVFGGDDAAAETFTAWHYAKFVEALTLAGKRKYPLPMFVNAALNRTGRKAGEYPSGGPLPHLIDVWKAGAPSLDFLAPDIYFPNFSDLAAHYARPDNMLFVPEANNAGKPEVPANAFYAFGKLEALGFSPFSIESVGDSKPNPLADAYAVIGQLAPHILEARGKGKMSGFRPPVAEDGTVNDAPVSEKLGGFVFTVNFIDPWTPRSEQNPVSHGGLILQTGPEDFLIAGQGITVTFKGAGDGPPLAGIDYAWEGSFGANGAWQNLRRLNGDQTHQGRHIRLPPGQYQIQKVRLYRYR
jgi:beta-galactosidase GanA